MSISRQPWNCRFFFFVKQAWHKQNKLKAKKDSIRRGQEILKIVGGNHVGSQANSVTWVRPSCSWQFSSNVRVTSHTMLAWNPYCHYAFLEMQETALELRLPECCQHRSTMTIHGLRWEVFLNLSWTMQELSKGPSACKACVPSMRHAPSLFLPQSDASKVTMSCTSLLPIRVFRLPAMHWDWKVCVQLPVIQLRIAVQFIAGNGVGGGEEDCNSTQGS